MTASALSSLAVSQASSGYARTSDGDSAPQVILIKLYPPKYPEIAIMAGTAGAVTLTVSVRPDGIVKSVKIVSGDRALTQAAVQSASQSQFQCRGCTGLTEKSLTYTFRPSQVPADPCCCSSRPGVRKTSPTTQVSQIGDHITVTAPPLCVCPDACTAAWAKSHSRFRSAKCLYLWKCGMRHISIQ